MDRNTPQPISSLIKAKKMMRPSTAGGKQVDFEPSSDRDTVSTMTQQHHHLKGQAEIIKKIDQRKMPHNRNFTQAQMINNMLGHPSNISISHFPSSSASSRHQKMMQSMKYNPEKHKSSMLMNIEEQLILEENN